MANEEQSRQYDLEDRTYEFARDVRAFVRELPHTVANINLEPSDLLRISDFGFNALNVMTNTSQIPTGQWTPRIVAFFCNWCTYTAADLAGVSRMKHAPNVRIIRLMCSGRVDPQFITDALARGADGVLIGGCHPNDCHYVEGNYKCLRRYQMLKRMLADMGIEPERVRLEWISAAEGEKVKRVVNEMVETLTQLGPLGIPQKFGEWDKEMEHFAGEVAAKEAAAGAGCVEHGTQPQTLETTHA